MILSIHQRWPWSPTPSPPLRTVETHIDTQVFSLENAPTEPTKEPKKRPWYFSGGTEFPSAFKGLPNLFPDQAEGDRVTEQLMYVPEDYEGM